jgi:hypothetical protein
MRVVTIELVMQEQQRMFVVAEHVEHVFAERSAGLAEAVAMGVVPLGASKTKPMTVKFDTGYTLESVSTFGPWSADTSGCVHAVVKGCKVPITFGFAAPFIGDGNLTVTECPIVPGMCVSILDPVSGRLGV